MEPRADHNKMTRHEFLRRILQSGEVTRIAQHLALAIVILAEDNHYTASARDLERMTGWSKSMIADHLAELDVFMKVTLGVGRGKTMFELQGVIEDAINKAVVSGSRTQDQASVPQPDAMADATPDTSSFVPLADAIADMSARRTQEQALASATRTQKSAASATKAAPHIATRATNESPTEIAITKKKSAPSSSADSLVVNCETITGPNFVVSLGAVDQQASLRGIPISFARQMAEAIAKQWAVSRKPPPNPDATIARALREEANAQAVQGVRLEKTRGAKPKSDPKAEADLDAALARRRKADEEDDARCRR